MANYISRNIISQSYVHVTPQWMASADPQETEQRISEIKMQMTSFAKSRIAFFLGSDLDVEVEFEEGSIIARITSYGKFAPLLAGLIVAYPQFSDGVKAMVKDAHEVGSYINSELLFQTGAKYKSERKSVEARLGVFGMIDRVNTQINELRMISNRKEVSTSTTYRKLLDLHEEILTSLDKILAKSSDKSDEEMAKKMWIEGVSGINLGKSHFKFNNPSDKDTYQLLVAEKSEILDSLKKRK